jgi:hypothetical protein
MFLKNHGLSSRVAGEAVQEGFVWSRNCEAFDALLLHRSEHVTSA